MNSRSWRPLDDISVDFEEEQRQSDGRVIEFSTWCEGEYCEPVRISSHRAAELLRSLAQALRRCKNSAAITTTQAQKPAWSLSRLIRIEAQWMDCYVVRVEPPECFRMLAPNDPHAAGYWTTYNSRAEALRCAIRESSRWLLWSVEHRAFDVGQEFANLAARFMKEAERTPIDPF